ncbi:MAG: ferrochelatase [Sphaerospermopsis kisseleviana]|jgi:ferrochelatase|uniref:Ferrochelatase n=2 Tax=Sphaerospermopsis TaxID=752201 RepID=A0ABR9VGK4_9CYAN|nr:MULTISPECIES: ferrochelatase [Sphaerospermopsis]BAZ81027.1 ferrochelatase [Sphaerospermopsis kisseleviana NIES-73]MBC5797954.1 ferrochelatase [Sphaerospermopsis sp. LEGE 00249]MBD2131747.1 ferrochelatase [Sphaerospermopsis sp. FACHB-1094]MBD2147542.1 ferrochelatase [Sphaerospermopsis sp. FACHB-1194]MBE9237619.1 ferrochelatase [Sphaerospermopsis aphanizomenoides LEGE 00250]
MGRVGVLLLNLGGPDKLEDVGPFLYNLFSDPEIIRLPFRWMQKPLAWFIATRREKTSQENYKQIGGGSPLRSITEEQGEALKTQLDAMGKEANIYVGMRYWHPYTEEAIAQLAQDNIDKLVILPLYPQFSISTSGSSFRLLEKLWQENPKLQPLEYTVIASWYKQPGYLQAMAELIIEQLNQFPNPDQAHIFFSAHGVPKSYVVEAGDPYQQEIEECTQLIMQTLNRPNAHTLAYQSRVGPVEWLQPYTEDALKELGEKGVKDLVVVPISFVSEHIETLQEIDIEYREIAEEAGIENFRRAAAPNTHPVFIQALADLVIESLEKPDLKLSQVTQMKKKVKMYPQERWEWGMTTSAEVWNGRIAMLGFIALIIEIITGRGLLHAIGLLQ